MLICQGNWHLPEIDKTNHICTGKIQPWHKKFPFDMRDDCHGFRILMRTKWPYHSDLFWEFRGGNSLGLKTNSCGVFLFVHDCLITHLSWKIHVRPKRSNFRWPWFFILYLIFSYENSSTYEQLSVKISKVFIGGAVFIWKYEV